MYVHSRFAPIMLLKLPIMLCSNAPEFYQLCSINQHYAQFLTSSIFLVPPECKISSTKELFNMHTYYITREIMYLNDNSYDMHVPIIYMYL